METTSRSNTLSDGKQVQSRSGSGHHSGADYIKRRGDTQGVNEQGQASFKGSFPVSLCNHENGECVKQNLPPSQSGLVVCGDSVDCNAGGVVNKPAVCDYDCVDVNVCEGNVQQNNSTAERKQNGNINLNHHTAIPDVFPVTSSTAHQESDSNVNACGSPVCGPAQTNNSQIGLERSSLRDHDSIDYPGGTPLTHFNSSTHGYYTQQREPCANGYETLTNDNNVDDENTEETSFAITNRPKDDKGIIIRKDEEDDEARASVSDSGLHSLTNLGLPENNWGGKTRPLGQDNWKCDDEAHRNVGVEGAKATTTAALVRGRGDLIDCRIGKHDEERGTKTEREKASSEPPCIGATTHNNNANPATSLTHHRDTLNGVPGDKSCQYDKEQHSFSPSNSIYHRGVAVEKTSCSDTTTSQPNYSRGLIKDLNYECDLNQNFSSSSSQDLVCPVNQRLHNSSCAHRPDDKPLSSVASVSHNEEGSGLPVSRVGDDKDADDNENDKNPFHTGGDKVNHYRCVDYSDTVRPTCERTSRHECVGKQTTNNNNNNNNNNGEEHPIDANGCSFPRVEYSDWINDYSTNEDLCESESEPLLGESTTVNNNNPNILVLPVVMATQENERDLSSADMTNRNGVSKHNDMQRNGFVKNKVGTAHENKSASKYSDTQKNGTFLITDGRGIDGVDGGSDGRYTKMTSGSGSDPGSNVDNISRINDDDDDDDDDGGPCGCGPIKCCQGFRSPLWFVLVITLFSSCQGMAINGFVNTVISTLERRFGISSTEGGLIASCYDIMFVILVIPVSYFGGHGNKPRYLAVGSFVMGLGSFLFCLPHFISDKYHVSNATETVCHVNGTFGADYCDKNTNPDLSYYKYFFYFGQMLHGAGATALYTLAAVYVDENVSQRSSSAYNAVFYTGSVIGPAIGYMLGGQFLKIYTDLDVDPDSLGLTNNNPRWVGAWWVGFLITGTFACFLSIPLLAFPPSLPGARKYAMERGIEAHKQKTADDTGKSKSIRDVLLSIRLLLLNVPFMCINLSAAADAILVSGFSTFLPKFIEYQYGKTAATAALYVGLAVVPAGGGATFVGGYLVTRFDLKMRGILRLCFGAAVVLIVLIFPFMLECETSRFAGVTLSYGETAKSSSFLGKGFEHSCNAGCGCVEENYYPMCGRDNIMYFSPCYAGCTSFTDDGDVKRYSDCKCVMYNLTSEDVASGSTYMGEFGKCDNSCKWLNLMMVFISIQIATIFITSMPSLTATLRCVPNHQRSFGLGIQWIVARCLGSIPGPILFGKMFDESCSLWQKKCEGSGSCFSYDNTDMRVYLLIISAAFALMAALFFFLALKFYKPQAADPAVTIEIKLEKSTSINTVLTDTSNPATPVSGICDLGAFKEAS